MTARKVALLASALLFIVGVFMAATTDSTPLVVVGAFVALCGAAPIVTELITRRPRGDGNGSTPTDRHPHE